MQKQNISVKHPPSFLIWEKEGRYISASKGTILFFQGDICPEMLLLHSGCVRVYVQNQEGIEITLYALEAGEQCIVNTSSVISNMPAVGTAICETDITGYLLDREKVHNLMIDSTEYQQFIFELFSLRLASLAELIEDIRFKPLEQRLIKWLHEQKKNEISITHERIAIHLGSSRVVISRLLKKLEKKGILSLSREKIRICA